MIDSTTHKANFLIKEYEKLKDEQIKRIDFRDQMIFVTLGAIGGVFSFVFEKPDYITALLVLPFVCIALGWTYLMNDEKVSEIGKYIRTVLIPRFQELNPNEKLDLQPSWEEFHRKVKRRKERKRIQMTIDLCIFCVSALLSISAFFYMCKCFSTGQLILGIVETLFILYLAYQFISYSDKSED